MSRSWPLLVLVALPGGWPTAAEAQQLKIEEKTTAELPRKYLAGQRVFSPDAKLLAVMNVPWDGVDPVHQVGLIESATGKEVALLRGHIADITAIAFRPDGGILATGSQDATIKLWDIKTRKQTQVLHVRPLLNVVQQRQEWGCHPTHLAFSPDGKTLAAAISSDRVLRLWDVESGKERAHLVPTSRDGPDRWTAIAFSPDGKTLVTQKRWQNSSQFGLTFWDMGTEAEKGGLGKSYRSAPGVGFAFSRDSKLFAEGREGKTVHLLDAASGEEKQKIEVNLGDLHLFGERGLAFSPEGKILAVNTANGVELIGVETGKPLAVFRNVWGPLFGPGGKTLTAYARAKTETVIKTWELVWEKEPGK